MSRRHNSPSRRARALAALQSGRPESAPMADSPTTDITAPGAYIGFGGGSNYAAATPSTSRGYLVWNTLDTRKETTRWDRLQLIRDSRALVANSGLARIIVTLSRLVGIQRPQANSSNRAWNDQAEATFKFAAKSSLLCDTRRLYNFWNVQPLLTFLALRDGEVFIVLTETQSGRARYAIYEAHRCTGQPPDCKNPEAWHDGIELDENGGAISYWFADPSDPRKGTQLSAYNVIHHANRDGLSPHGLPALTHAIVHLKDIIETRGYTKAALKIAAMLGIVITSDANASGPQRPLLSGLQNGQTPFSATQTSNPDPLPAVESPAKPQDNTPKYETMLPQGGGGNTVLKLDPGQKTEILHDDRPGPNSREFSFDLLSDAAIGIGVPPSFVYFIDKLSGPMTRAMINQASAWIRSQQDKLRDCFLDRYYVYSTSKDEKAGYLSGTPLIDPATGEQMRSPTGKPLVIQRPTDWYLVTWQRGPALESIDTGRDGNLELQQYFAGIATLSSLTEIDGHWWEDIVDQKALEAEYQIQAAQKVAATTGQDFNFVFPLIRKSDTLNTGGAPTPMQKVDQHSTP